MGCCLPACLQMGAPLLQPLHSWSDHTLPVTCLAVGAGDGAALVASGSLDRSVKLRSLSAAAVGSAPLRSVALPAAVHSLALDPGEHALYAGCSSGAIYDIQLAAGQPTQYDLADGGGSAAATAAAAGGSSCVHPVMQGHTRAVTSLGLTPDASLLVSGGEDCAVRVWDLRSRQPVRLLQNPAKGPVSALLVLSQPPYLQVLGMGWGGSKGPWELFLSLIGMHVSAATAWCSSLSAAAAHAVALGARCASLADWRRPCCLRRQPEQQAWP
jgi:pre-rRNA-processing protein IPI3